MPDVSLESLRKEGKKGPEVPKRGAAGREKKTNLSGSGNKRCYGQDTIYGIQSEGVSP